MSLAQDNIALLLDALLQPPKSKSDSLKGKFEPRSIEDFLDQHPFAELLQALLKKKEWPSLLVAGQRGWGQSLLAKFLGAEAVKRGHKVIWLSEHLPADELRQWMAEAEQRARAGQHTVLYTGEPAKRFNQPRQDIVAPYVKGGIVSLLSATTQDEGMLIPSLRAEVAVLRLMPLDESRMIQLLRQVEGHLGRPLPLEEESRSLLCRMAEGDKRFLLRFCDRLAALPTECTVKAEELRVAVTMAMLYRGLAASDASAALLWLAYALRMGVETQNLGRLLIRFAAVEVGPADLSALGYAVAATQTAALLGREDASAALTGAVMRLAESSKSSAVAQAYAQAREDAEKLSLSCPPRHLVQM